MVLQRHDADIAKAIGSEAVRMTEGLEAENRRLHERVAVLESNQKRRPMDSFPSGTRLAEWAIPDGTSHGWYMTSWRGRTDRSDGCWFADTHNARHLLAQPIHWVELPDQPKDQPTP